MTRPGIEPRSPGPLANTLTARPMSGLSTFDGVKQIYLEEIYPVTLYIKSIFIDLKNFNLKKHIYMYLCILMYTYLYMHVCINTYKLPYFLCACDCVCVYVPYLNEKCYPSYN